MPSPSSNKKKSAEPNKILYITKCQDITKKRQNQKIQKKLQNQNHQKHISSFFIFYFFIDQHS